MAPNEPEFAALAVDVNRLATALADTEQRRTGLIGDIAHEMRTPLTTITGYVEGFDDALFAKDEMVVTVSDEIARLRRLADDLAAVSRAVFERFYRAEPQAHTAGTGIGLTIARAVAHAHRGDLTAFSPGVGRGATFTLSLPRRRLPPRAG